MNEYTEHQDRIGRDIRVRTQNHNAMRARMQAAFAEYDLGAVTLFLPANVAQLRAREAIRIHYAPSARSSVGGLQS